MTYFLNISTMNRLLGALVVLSLATTTLQSAPVAKVNVSAEAIDGGYWEYESYSETATDGHGESKYYAAMATCDAAPDYTDSDTGVSSQWLQMTCYKFWYPSGYVFWKAWYYAWVDVDLRDYTNSSTHKAWIQWTVTENIRHSWPSYEATNTYVYSQPLPLNSTSTVYQAFEPQWYNWAQFLDSGSDYTIDWNIAEPTVWVAEKDADIQPDPIRPQAGIARTRDPINTISGNVSYDTTDIAVPTPGLPSIFARAYNSADDRDGPLGPRWSHSYHWTLSETNTVFDGETNTWKVLRTGDGSDHRFEVNGGSYEAPFDLNWSLADATPSGYTLTIPPAIEYSFTSNGILSAIEDGSANTVTMTYSNGTDLVEAEHSNGLSLEFGYTSGNLTSVSSPDADLSMSFAYNGSGELTNATRTVAGQSQITAYSYDTGSNHLLTVRTNPNGDEFEYAYAADGRGTNMTLNTNWYTHAVAYSNDWNQTHVTYERRDTNQTFVYHINPIIQRVTEIAGPPSGVGTRFEYDDYGNATNEVFYDDNLDEELITVRAFDSAHNVTNETTGYGTASDHLWHYTWHTNLQALTSVTDPEDNSVEHDYSAAGLLSESRQFPTAGTTLTTSYGYTTHGLLAAVTNANGHSVQFDHDANGYLAEVDPQLGPTITYSNSVLGHVEKVILPGELGDRITEFNVDPLGRILGITHADDTTEGMTYDSLGNMTAHTNTEDSVTMFEYLPAHRLSKIVHTGWDGLTITNRFNYDRQFNTLDIVDALDRNVESYVLDLQDRPTTVTNVEGQTMSVEYGLGQMVKSVTRFDGTTVSNAYDGDARLDAVYYPDATIDFDYYDNGLLKSADSTLGTVSNEYDGANRLVASDSEFNGLTGAVAYGLDGVGNTTNTTVTVDGKTLTADRTFDAAERLSTLSASGELSSALDFAYSHNPYNGLVAAVTNDTTGGHVAYTFDDMDRLESITWKDDLNSTVRSFGYAYSAAGMITNVTLESGERLVYTYDSLQRLTSEKRLSSAGATLREESFTYDKVGNRKTKALDGTTVAYSFPYGNQGNRLASWSSSTTDDYEVGRLWDVAGHSSENVGTNDRYGVLSVSNVVTVTLDYSGTNFTADAFPIGSGTQEVVAAIRDDAGNMGYATNTVTTRIVTNAVYGYSDAGCVTSIVYSGISHPEKTIGLEWNGQYQLTAVRENGSLAESCGYDALGRRAWISDGTSTNWMVYDGQHLAAEVDDSGDLLRRYIAGPGIDNMLGMVSYKGGETNAYFFLTDHLGTVHAVLDVDGDVVEAYEYDAWGRVLAVEDGEGNALAESAIGNRILWQGREFSWASGLYFHRARYYDPSVCRWTARDPAGVAGGQNLYAAFNNNAVAYADPDGLDAYLILDPDGPNFARGAGHTDVAVDSIVGGVLVRSAAWGVVDQHALPLSSIAEASAYGKRRAIRFPERILPSGQSSDRLIETYIRGGGHEAHAYLYCSVYCSDVLRYGGFSVGRGRTPTALMRRALRVGRKMTTKELGTMHAQSKIGSVDLEGK